MVEHDDAAATTAAKREIRARVRAARSQMGQDRRAAASAELTRHLTGLVTDRGARSVATYVSVGTEPDTRPFLAWAREHGVEVLLPSVRGDGLMDWTVDTGLGFAEGAFGIPEPIGERLGPLAVAEAELLLIPACAVDRRGMRLGWGRGYFDRCLASLVDGPAAFALINANELLDEVPREPHDIPVAGVVTPAGVVRMNR